MPQAGRVVLELANVGVRRGGAVLVDGVDLCVRAGQRWVLLGPNGAGKTTVLQMASTYLRPTTGAAWVLGHRLGQVNVWDLRRRIGYASPAYARLLRPELTALQAVVTGARAAAATFGQEFTAEELARGRWLLADAGLLPLADRRLDRLSEGERQRVQLARTLMADPELLLLDEPMAGVDVAGRERLLAQLDAIGTMPGSGPSALVLVTHHVEEIPRCATHVALLKGGRVRAAGRLGEVLTAPALSEVFGVPLSLERRSDRWTAWSDGSGRTGVGARRAAAAAATEE